MDKQFSIAEAKNKLPAIIHEVEHGPPATLTRHGTPVAVVISVRQYEAMTQHKPDFWNAIVKWRQSIQADGDAVSDTDFNNLRDKSTGREVNL